MYLDITENTPARTVVRFPASVGSPTDQASPDLDDPAFQLAALVGATRLLCLDLSATRTLADSAEWQRVFHALDLVGRQCDCRVVVVGASETFGLRP